MRPLLTLLACLLCGQLFAQDTLYYRTKPGTETVQVLEISPAIIKYRLYDQPDGPIRELRKGELNKIVFANGTTTWLNADAWERYEKWQRTGEGSPDIPPRVPAGIRFKPTGNRIISFMPLSIQTNGWGVTFSYEQLRGKKQQIGIRIPLVLTYMYSGFYVQPGLRYYPFGQHVFTPFVTLSLYAGYGNRSLRRKVRDVSGNLAEYRELMTGFQYGAYVDVGFHVQWSKHLSLTMSGGPGLCVSDFFKLRNYESKLFGKYEIGLAYRFFTKK